MVMNFSMKDLNKGRRFYDSNRNEVGQPREKLNNEINIKDIDKSWKRGLDK